MDEMIFTKYGKIPNGVLTKIDAAHLQARQIISAAGAFCARWNGRKWTLRPRRKVRVEITEYVDRASILYMRAALFLGLICQCSELQIA